MSRPCQDGEAATVVGASYLARGRRIVCKGTMVGAGECVTTAPSWQWSQADINQTLDVAIEIADHWHISPEVAGLVSYPDLLGGDVSG
jgi:hypothetical protein